MNLRCSYRLLLGALLVVFVPALRAQTPVITSPGNATGQIAVPFAYTINATGNPTSYSIVSTAPSSLIQGVYRGAFGSQTTASGKIWMAGSGQEFPNGPAFAAITSNGSAVAWGNPDAGGNATAVSSSLSSNITAIYSNSQAFAALKSNGSVVTWGDDFYGGSTSGAVGGNLTSGVVSISSTSSAFAALKSNGSVVTWGDPERGGNSTSRVGGNLTSNVTAIYSNAGAFAALKSNGSVVTWGDPGAGGNSTLFEFDQDLNIIGNSVADRLTSGVVSISSTQVAFAARKSDGSVVTWGDMAASGAYTPPSAGSLSSNVTAVFSNDDAFAALKSNGSVVTWGASMSGGDSSSVSANLSSNVTAIYSNQNAFAALKSNGSVVTWGGDFFGGDSSSPIGGNLASNVKSISSTQWAFAALKNDGSVVTWGDSMSGGDSSLVTPPPFGNFQDPPTFTSVANSLTSNVTAIYATGFAFAALKKDGSVVTWGSANLGGDASSVAASLSSNVTAIAANSGAFAALKRDGSVVTWGLSTPIDIPAPANIGAPAADITSLTGLSFNSANGSLSGSPTKSGNFSLRLGATNASGTGNAPFSLLILPAPGMSLSGNLSFGNVFVGQNATRNFSIANPASGPLTVSSIASSNSFFTLTGSTNFTVAPTTTQNVTVRFQPAAPGNFTANITVASNAGNNSLTATGTGAPAASPITITGNLSFGNVTVNQTANSTLSIKNNSSGNVTLSLANPPSWLTANVTGNFTLAGNATRNVTVSFRPVAEQAYTANLTIASGLGNSTIPASGNGVHSRIISLTGNLSFGSVGVNATANRILSISNIGTGNLTVSGISYPLGFSGNWSAGTIAANSTQNVTVSFRPATAGNFIGTITVNSTATSGNSTIAASGTGVLAPVITGNLSASGAVGTNFSYHITATSSPASFGNATALPAGLILNSTTGLISGTPATVGNTTVTLTATNAGGTGNATLVLRIAAAPLATSQFTGGKLGSPLVNGLNDIDGDGINDVSLADLGSFAAIDATGGYGLTGESGGGAAWVRGNSTIVAPDQAGKNEAYFSPFRGNIMSSSDNWSKVRFSSGDGWVQWKFAAGSSPVIPLVFVREAPAQNLSAAQAWEVAYRGPAITSAASANGSVGTAFNFQVTASNNATSFSASSLPAGLTINATTGLISGTPTAVGSSIITLSATNASGIGVANLTLTISPSRIIGLTGNLSFGNATVNSTTTRNLTITNTGTGNLNITGISSSNASFVLTGNTTNLVVGPGGNRTVGVVFQPASTGNFTGTITVNSTATNAAGNSTIAASGTGVPSRIISLTGNLSFGSVGVNATATRTLSISNTGNGPLTVTGISYPSGFSGNFTGTINPNATQNVTVSFRPTSAGNFTGNITLNSTATSGNSAIATSGTGVLAPVITSNLSASGAVGGNFSYQITASNNPASFGNATALPAGLSLNATTGLISGKPTAPFTGNITLRATNAGGTGTANLTVSISQSRIIALSGNLSFGNATVNSTFTRNLIITNTGTGPLSVSGISYPPGFSGNWSGTINATATQNVTISFRPTSEGPFIGNITVNSTATSGSNTISVSGTGVHSRIIGLSGDLAFGSAVANRTLDKNPTRTLTISNSGTGNLTVTRIERPAGFRVFASLPDPSLGGNYTTVNFTYSGFSVSLAELTGNFTLPIAAGTSKSLFVAFSPTAAATYSGNITVASNATNAAGNSTRAASGTGVTSPLSITGNLSFGNVTVNQQAQRTLSITNLDSESHALSFAIGAGYSVAFSPFPYDVMGNPVTLQAGATVNATVTFFPTSATAHSGNLSIISATAGNRTIPATGTATHSRIIGLTGNLSFGSLPVNQTANRMLSIRNTGTGRLNVTGITYPTGISGNWSSGTIAANATQNVTISFRPTSDTPLTANITVTSDATSGTPTIPASGTGIHSRIIGLTGNLSFGTLTVNQTANRTLTISNTGTGPFNVIGITYPAGFSGNFSGTINPNTTQNVTVSFRPATPGNFTGTISVNSTATSGNSSITATGTAILLPVITTTNLHGTKGLSFSQRILATNNATTFGNATALPVGLTINRTTGLISGTMPTGPLISFSVNITATNAYGATSAPVTFWFWDDLLSVAGGALKTSNVLNNTLVPSFRIGKYEVTWFEWKAVREWAVANGYTDLVDVGAGSGDLHPVRDVNWYDVVKWCNAKSERDGLTPVYTVGAAVYKTGQSVPTVNIAAKGYRLPMAAEWEWAFRGGTSSKGYTYSGSNTASVVAWTFENSSSGTQAVGTKAANELGIYDMSGNVWELCWDLYQNSSLRLFRGGGWKDYAFFAEFANISNVNGNDPDYLRSDIGFRLARSSDEQTSVYGTVGVPVSYQLTAANTSTSFGNATALPAGLSLNATTGLISGTPMVAGNSTVTLRATNAGVTGTANVTFSIKPDLITVQGGTLPQSSALWGTPVSTFRIGTFEVTRSLWQIVRTWGVTNGYTDLPSIAPGSNGNHPVQEVSWYDVLKWCNARSAMENLTPVYKVGKSVYKTGQSEPSVDASANGYRLPTEAEWEWAARGGVSTKGYTYSGGNDLQAVGRFSRGSSGVWPVGGLAANEIGLYDMSGNVKEWCWDVWNDAGKISRRQRGGSWSSGESQCALTDRGGSPFPQNRYDDIGFRLVRKSGN